MDELRQKVTFEVAEAVTNLTEFQKKLASVNRTLNTFAQRAQGSKGLTGVTTDLQGLEKAAGSSLEAVTNGAKKATTQVGRLTTSLQLLSRIVYTQLIVRTMTSLRLSLEDSINQFIEFEKAVSQLETISSSFATFDELAQVTRNLSDNFNIELIDATRGAYEAVSNQVVKSTGDFAALNEIALFSKATNTSLATSINLVTGAMNAYQKPVSQANELTAQFFRTIDLGRIGAAELDTAFGRVAPAAAQLGFSTEFVNAGLAALTINGVKSSEAATQLVGIMTALVKPSTEMKQVFKELGVESAEQLIQTYGQVGALTALREATDGTVGAISKLVLRERGLRGFLTLTRNDAETLTDYIGQIGDSASDLATNAGMKVLRQDGQRVAAVFNQISNVITTDVGRAITQTIADVTRIFDGVDSVANSVAIITKGIYATVTAMGVAGAAVAAYGAEWLLSVGRIKEAELLTARLNNTLRTTVLRAGAVAAAFVIGDIVGDLIGQYQNSGLNKLVADTKKINDNIVQIGDDQLKAVNKTFDELDRVAAEKTRDLRKIYNTDLENFQEVVDKKNQLLETSLDGVVDAQQERVKALEQVAKDSISAIERSAQRSRDLAAEIDDLKFEEKLSKLSDPQQFTQLLKRSSELAREASNQFAKARSEEDIRSAQTVFDRAEAAAQEAAQSAETLGNRRAEEAASRQIIRLKQNQLLVEKQLRQDQEAQRKQAEQAAAVENARLDRLKAAVTEINKLSSPFDEQGNLLEREELDKREAQLAKQLSTVQKEIFASDQLKIADVLGVAQLGQRVRESLGSTQIESIQFGDKTFQEFRRRIEESQYNLKIAVNEQDLLKTQREASTKIVADTTERTLALANSKAQEVALAELAQRAKDGLDGAFATLSTGIVERNNIKALTDQVFQQVTTGQSSPELIAQQRIEMGKLLQETGVGTAQVGSALNAFFDVAAGLAQNQITILYSAQQQLQTQQQITAQLERQKQLSQSIASPTAAPVGRQYGGMLYRAFGGAARGTDSIAAMLTPGEFVTNAKNSRRFFSQLQAINAGVQPVNRQQGGSVTNVSIGDINVTGGSNPRQTGRQIANEVRREMRRGTTRSLS